MQFPLLHRPLIIIIHWTRSRRRTSCAIGSHSRRVLCNSKTSIGGLGFWPTIHTHIVNRDANKQPPNKNSPEGRGGPRQGNIIVVHCCNGPCLAEGALYVDNGEKYRINFSLITLNGSQPATRVQLRFVLARLGAVSTLVATYLEQPLRYNNR